MTTLFALLFGILAGIIAGCFIMTGCLMNSADYRDFVEKQSFDSRIQKEDEEL